MRVQRDVISLRVSRLDAGRARRFTWWPLLAATTATTGVFASVLGSLRYAVLDRTEQSRAWESVGERIVLTSPRTTRTYTVDATSRARVGSSSSARSPRTLISRPRDTGAAAPPVVRATTPDRALPSTALSPDAVPRLALPGPERRAWPSPRIAFDPFAEPAPPAPAERDSALSALATMVPDLASLRKITPAERDSAYKEAAQKIRQTERILLVPPDNSGGMITMPLPFLSRGPSRARRAREQRAHDEGRARLQRLLARADSLRRARADSTSERR